MEQEGAALRVRQAWHAESAPSTLFTPIPKATMGKKGTLSQESGGHCLYR